MKAVNLAKKTVTVTEIMNFPKGLFLLAHPVGLVSTVLPFRCVDVAANFADSQVVHVWLTAEMNY